ncbi:hypothetical protein GCM10011341_12550 [Frigidibacter albus]|nr:hypothetical protein GCM10011341_12550 [Frigidibacter albus]
MSLSRAGRTASGHDALPASRGALSVRLPTKAGTKREMTGEASSFPPLRLGLATTAAAKRGTSRCAPSRHTPNTAQGPEMTLTAPGPAVSLARQAKETCPCPQT